jgi:catechol 2,3-dioxygenase-like lactoylglutathione lyase family enzyme
MTNPETPGEFGRAVPILRIASLEASLAYYVEVLGFQVDWKVEGNYASVHRGKASLMLSVGDQGHPGTWVWIGVDDADALQDELRARGTVIRQPPTNYPGAACHRSRWARPTLRRGPQGRRAARRMARRRGPALAAVAGRRLEVRGVS